MHRTARPRISNLSVNRSILRYTHIMIVLRLKREPQLYLHPILYLDEQKIVPSFKTKNFVVDGI